jgi:hypothetical protein
MHPVRRLLSCSWGVSSTPWQASMLFSFSNSHFNRLESAPEEVTRCILLHRSFVSELSKQMKMALSTGRAEGLGFRRHTAPSGAWANRPWYGARGRLRRAPSDSDPSSSWRMAPTLNADCLRRVTGNSLSPGRRPLCPARDGRGGAPPRRPAAAAHRNAGRARRGRRRSARLGAGGGSTRRAGREAGPAVAAAMDKLQPRHCLRQGCRSALLGRAGFPGPTGRYLFRFRVFWAEPVLLGWARSAQLPGAG